MGHNIYERRGKKLVVVGYVPDDWEIEQEVARRIRSEMSIDEQLKAMREAIAAIAAGKPLPASFQSFESIAKKHRAWGKERKAEAATLRQEHPDLDEARLWELPVAKLRALAERFQISVPSGLKGKAERKAIIEALVALRDGRA